jgi:hypothetical protein
MAGTPDLGLSAINVPCRFLVVLLDPFSQHGDRPKKSI